LRLWLLPARRKLRAAIESIRSLAGFGFDEFGDDDESLGFGEALDRGLLRLDAQTRALLFPCRDTKVGNSALHTKGIPPFALCMNPLSEQCHCSFHVAAANDCAAERKSCHCAELSDIHTVTDLAMLFLFFEPGGRPRRFAFLAIGTSMIGAPQHLLRCLSVPTIRGTAASRQLLGEARTYRRHCGSDAIDPEAT
jgi:hypothetical protein